MCKWHKRPQGRKKRVAWLRRFIFQAEKRLEAGYIEAWHRAKHYTVEGQRKACEAKIAKARRELEALSAA